jgi:antitoxin component YwqK of YwqJK toxin-antitoxin module
MCLKIETAKYKKETMKRSLCVLMLFIGISPNVLFADDKSLSGLQKEYYPNGAVHYERNYTNGEKDGLAKEYYEDGTLKREVSYVLGKMQGTLKEYYPTGVLEATFEFKDNVVHGIVAKYYVTGKLEHESIYEYGQPASKGVKVFKYYDDGSLKYEYSYDKDSGGYRKEYYSNGQMSLDMTIKGWNSYSCKNYDQQGNFVSMECPKTSELQIRMSGMGIGISP